MNAQQWTAGFVFGTAVGLWLPSEIHTVENLTYGVFVLFGIYLFCPKD